MSKVTKLIKHPVKFFEDAAKKKKEIAKLSGVKNPVFAFRINDWKRPIIEAWMPDKTFIYVPFKANQVELEKKWLPLIEKTTDAEILVWGMNLPKAISNTTKPIKYVEDGFIRSVELGSKHTPPLSLNFDSKTPYFDATKESDLECILSSYDFESDAELMARAEKNIQNILTLGISKYNNGRRKSPEDIYPTKGGKKRILVIGQVEDDASIIYGCSENYNNNDLVKLAAYENPEADIYYKPHPDVLHNRREMLSNPNEVKNICELITDNIAIADVLSSVDHVYTITSQVGFEALLRGIKVTTLGCPFYAGWGLTDDRQKNKRRTRKLTVEQVFAASYILYPQYFDPIHKKYTTLEKTVEYIQKLIEIAEHRKPVKSIKKDKSASASTGAEKKITASKLTGPSVPDWYNAEMGYELAKAFESPKPMYLFIPWISEHSNSLIKNISSDDYDIAPLDFVKDLSSNRRNVLKFARENPDVYRRMIVRRLIPLRHKLVGVIFTFDWAPVMRIISHVCEELNIPRILIPHESVFVDQNKYYWDPKSFASQPLADITLGWGGLQKAIFTSRGYPQDRFVSVGAPKFDKYVDYKPKLERAQFYRLFGLDPGVKTILFASQPLDSQLDMRIARESQRKAISDLLLLCEDLELQLIVRLPPSKDNILGEDLDSKLKVSSVSAIDDALCYMVAPEEAIYHCDIVSSVNSTMLFEGFLMGRMPLSTKYVEFDQIWDNCNFPIAKNHKEVRLCLEEYLNNGFIPDPKGLAWAADMFSNGAFDGQSNVRIKNYLMSWSTLSNRSLQSSSLEKIFNQERVDIVGIPSGESTWTGTQKYLLPMLNANQRVQSAKGLETISELASVDVFVQWGITERTEKKKQVEVKKALGRHLIYVEDGFIRSLRLGLSGEPGLSIILDDTTSYYDATKISRLERLLEHGPDLDPVELERSKDLIDNIIVNRISKYNHAPDLKLDIGSPDRPKLLLIDQRYGDQSVISGMADETSFSKMLHDAINDYPDYDILIKQHPDAITGGKTSYFNNDFLSCTKFCDNVYIVDFDVNPHVLFDTVDEVFVATSGMGFEALMRGKKVHCYGVPFYSGWGITEDKKTIARRTRRRSVYEIFHFAYVVLSRYYDPSQNKRCEIESLIKYISNNR
ncbi:hypothetical protein [Salinicola aestuarinus]|uniref:capsular polysaccharide export protein, LipB/KpsS family n=1 Tax=Salinicola aestuarinus TaxID=1949082 RepID=UPI000DA1A032|nr:hypothetical protein [Salinicola aestuarinus]